MSFLSEDIRRHKVRYSKGNPHAEALSVDQMLTSLEAIGCEPFHGEVSRQAALGNFVTEEKHTEKEGSNCGINLECVPFTIKLSSMYDFISYSVAHMPSLGSLTLSFDTYFL
jgi:hypothetical protein